MEVLSSALNVRRENGVVNDEVKLFQSSRHERAACRANTPVGGCEAATTRLPGKHLYFLENLTKSRDYYHK